MCPLTNFVSTSIKKLCFRFFRKFHSIMSLSEPVQSAGDDSHELEEVMREINDSFPIESPKGEYGEYYRVTLVLVRHPTIGNSI